MKYLVVDGELNGTGVRDKYEGDHIEIEDLNLSSKLILRIDEWRLEYERVHYGGFRDRLAIEKLDLEGVQIAKAIKNELVNVKIEYFSHAKLTRVLIDDGFYG